VLELLGELTNLGFLKLNAFIIRSCVGEALKRKRPAAFLCQVNRIFLTSVRESLLNQSCCPRNVHQNLGHAGCAIMGPMNQNRIIACFIAAIISTICASPLNAGQSTDQSQQRAVALWEEALQAKGGRGRLYSIRSMVISSSGSYKPLEFKIKPEGEVSSRSGKHSGIFREELYVFPDMLWAWEDYRPAVFGLWLSVYNYQTKTAYVITDGEPNHPAEPIAENEPARRGFSVTQLMYLMESSWLKPKVVKVTTEKIGFRVVDVIQTEADAQRYDFAIDRKTHLPVRLTFYSQYNGRVYRHVNGLSDYIDVDGIRVPLTLELEDGHKERSNITFNVDYDEKIFGNPPSIEAGPKAWMKVK
jgi:hypothetical protein